VNLEAITSEGSIASANRSCDLSWWDPCAVVLSKIRFQLCMES
jgi:hypothetical protein